MSLSKPALFALGILVLCAPGAVFAQANQWDKPADLKLLIPPVLPLPPAARINPGSVGGTQTPYTTAPLQNPNLSPSEQSPGIRLTIPSR
jgi:hypothetical protein